MPGTISLSMSQQFKRSGAYAIPLSGGKLYTLAAGETNTPQSSYQDFGLTIPHPNPIILDESGFVPPFYLADGFIKIRLDDAAGLTIRNYDNILVVGPSSGEGGGGGWGVDPTTVFQTGDVMWLDVQGSRTGWVRDNGRTIGSATSGATERANADCEPLFLWLWANYDNTFCPVSTGRGVSAAADWAANKTIQLRNKQNCVAGGLDDMGNTAAGGFANVPIVQGDATTASSILGETTHQLLKAELPATPPTGTVAITDPGHTHQAQGNSGPINLSLGSGALGFGSLTTSASLTGITAAFTGDNLGSGTAHNNVQKTVLGSFYRKL
jgi:hypothetical protein